MYRKRLTIDAFFLGCRLHIRESRICSLTAVCCRIFRRVVVSCLRVATLHIIPEFLGFTSGVLRRPPPNQSLQVTAGRSDASHYTMKTFPFQSMLAPASGT
jgi:hypothetical protein